MSPGRLERLAGSLIQLAFRVRDGLHYEGRRRPQLALAYSGGELLSQSEPLALPAPEQAPVEAGSDRDWLNDPPVSITIPMPWDEQPAPVPVEAPVTPEAPAKHTPSPSLDGTMIIDWPLPIPMPSAAQMTTAKSDEPGDLVETARALLAEGHSRRSVAKMLGVAESTLRGRLKKASA